MQTTTRERDTTGNVMRMNRGAIVHARARSGLTSYRVLYCDGRATSNMVVTSLPVTCERCIRAGAQG